MRHNKSTKRIEQIEKISQNQEVTIFGFLVFQI